jgi:hypothetical protein
MRNLCWWIIGRVSGKTVFTGPYRSESEALSKANNIQDFDLGDFDVKHYPTSDMARAKSMYKAQLTDKSGLMGNAFMRIGNANSDKAVKNTGHLDRLNKIKAQRGIE